METRTPVFEEFDPESDCDCPGCVHWRRVLPHSTTARHPAAGRALIVAAAASTTLAVGHTAPALAAPHVSDRPGVPTGGEPDSPQGGKAPLHGPGGQPAKPGPVKTPEATRAEIIKRAKKWVAAKVPYSMSRYWSDGYRQDCSGFVSMAWKLPGNEWTGSLGQYGVRIARADLQPGDILLFHNPDDPQRGSHVVIFGGWTDYRHTHYVAYESTRPHARRLITPYAYWSHSDRYVAYRYKGLVSTATGTKPDTAEPDPAKPDTTKPDPVKPEDAKLDTTKPDPAKPQGAKPEDAKRAVPFPGRAYFGPGANNKHVTQLGRMLAERGAGRYFPAGPGPRWTDADRKATRAFQLAQGWRGRDADGLPGPRTWVLLVTGKGKDVQAEGTVGPDGQAVPAAPASHGVAGYPGRAMFRPGANNKYVTQLGKQLVKKGFGKHFKTGPGSRWGETDRRAVEAFQRAQGWRGGAADGYPGPETWRRLFS
ncbi:Cell wall-associated hydrolase, NlpC family [Streptomyces sp. cf386]|uniref:peptidoglycan-binding protein n=1 Tax=Streptomyces sp. cf386 TaxID=1761904 RepID=UPI0008845C5E|nr:peptidoglycan-binding protein [Streptomyces sp. cf386]SDO35270.1 Cell wall-associated hydrolase, NlpC family [Streptomyces sp. cf386]